jgi:GDP-L-fucose synthase
MRGHINIGSGGDVTIGELAEAIGRVVGYQGRLEFDATKPDGAPRKLMDSRRIAALGWRSTTPLMDGLQKAYADFLQTFSKVSVA